MLNVLHRKGQLGLRLVISSSKVRKLVADLKNQEMKKLVILGAGTAGCVAAAALARQLKPDLYEITVLDSSYIDGIGVGESVLPSFTAFLHTLGLDEQDFIRQSGASIKLGIQFRDWNGNNDSFFHHLGSLGCELDGFDFFNCWLKARSRGDLTPLQDYAPAAVMAGKQRFDLPGRFPPGSPLTGADHALLLEAGLVCRYLRDYAEQRKVKFIKAHAVRVNLGERGCIESLELNNRESVAGDFFIDCSGSRGLLIGEGLGADYESWKQFLPCDRAVAVQTPAHNVMPPYSVSTAMESGWTWRIPLQKRLSSGYVFSSEHSTDHRAISVLLDSLEGKPVREPHFIPFRNGMRKQLWKKNCIALGLAGGFLEPLESTAFHLAIRGVEHMLELFPNLHEEKREWPTLAAEYDGRMRVDYEEIRDFIILHYCTSRRTDTEFWRRRQSLPVPDSLAARIELFKSRAQLRVADNSLFDESSWFAVLTGMGVIPDSWHPFVDMADFAAIHQAMQVYKTQLCTAVAQLPAYEDFVNGVSTPTVE